MKKSSLWLSAAGALFVAASAGRLWQNHLFCRPSVAAQRFDQSRPDCDPESQRIHQGRPGDRGRILRHPLQLQRQDSQFSVSGFSGALPVSIQNMPEEELGAVYGSGDGSLTYVNYAKENTAARSRASTAFRPACSPRATRYLLLPPARPLTFLPWWTSRRWRLLALSLPGVYRVSVNPGGTVAMAFVQNSNYIYYVRKLSRCETTNYSGGPTTWPKSRHRLRAVECARVVPSPGAEPRPPTGSKWDPVLWRSADVRPADQGALLARWRNGLHVELRPGMRRIHGVRRAAYDGADGVPARPAIRQASHPMARSLQFRFPGARATH